MYIDSMSSVFMSVCLYDFMYNVSICDLGDRDKVGPVAVHASPLVYRDSMLQESLGTHSRGSVRESELALITIAVGLSAGETEVIVGDQLEDLR